MKNLPPFDPEKARVLKKLAENPCATLTEGEENILESEPWVELEKFTPPPKPKFQQLSFPGL